MAAGRKCHCGNRIHERSKSKLCSDCMAAMEAMQQQNDIEDYQRCNTCGSTFSICNCKSSPANKQVA